MSLSPLHINSRPSRARVLAVLLPHLLEPVSHLHTRTNGMYLTGISQGMNKRQYTVLPQRECSVKGRWHGPQHPGQGAQGRG